MTLLFYVLNIVTLFKEKCVQLLVLYYYVCITIVGKNVPMDIITYNLRLALFFMDKKCRSNSSNPWQILFLITLSIGI